MAAAGDGETLTLPCHGKAREEGENEWGRRTGPVLRGQGRYICDGTFFVNQMKGRGERCLLPLGKRVGAREAGREVLRRS